MPGGIGPRTALGLAAAVVVVVVAAAGFAAPAAAAPCPCRLLANDLVPTQTGLSTTNGRSGGGPFTLELGVKFTLDAPARLSSIAFYKDGAETGTHTARLWTADGILLGSVPFAAETASGRQEQALPTPIGLAAGVTAARTTSGSTSPSSTSGARRRAARASASSR